MDKIKFINGETLLNDESLNKMQDNIERAIAVGGVAGDTLPIGTVVEFASDTSVPENWLLCNGQEVSRTEYDLLFAVIGTTWGAGNGSTTFNVPTKEGLVTVGKKSSDADFNTLGKTGGEKAVTLTIDEMPSHQHKMSLNNYGSDYCSAVEWSSSEEGGQYKYSGDMIEPAGGDQPHNNLQPYVTSNFIIKARQSSGVVANVVDSLDSDSSKDALSARQGKELKNAMIEYKGRYTGSCNDINENCVVYIQGGSDCPVYAKDENYGYLFTKYVNENYATQTFDLANYDRTWKRIKKNGVWGEWYLLSSEFITSGKECLTNEYIDGKQVYRKRINYGVLPNASYSVINTGLLYDDVTVERITGIAKRITDGQYIALPLVNVETLSNQIAFVALNNAGNLAIRIVTGGDRSNMTAIVDVYYTKNS